MSSRVKAGVAFLILCSGPLVSWWGVAAAPSGDVLRVSGIEYRVDYAKKPDPRTAGAVTASVTVSATRVTTGKTLWRRQLASIWGNYRAKSFDALGFTVDRLVAGADPGGLAYLFVHRARPSVHVLDAATGRDLLVRCLDRIEAVPLAARSEVRLVRLEPVDIQAGPGYGISVHLRNTGSTPLLLGSSHLSPFQLEGQQSTTRKWEKLAVSALNWGDLLTVAPGAAFKLFLDAAIFEKLVGANAGAFSAALQAGRQRKAGSHWPLAGRLKALPGGARQRYDRYRLELVFLAPGKGDRPIAGVFKTHVAVELDALRSLISGAGAS